MSLLISIIIVNWNAEKYIKNCIESLINQTYKNFEIILVDNASSDNSVEIIEKKFPQVKIIKNSSNLGFAEGNNIGIKESNGNLIALFNPDAVADKDWISKLVSVLTSSDKIAGVTGKLFYLGDQFGKDAIFCTWSKISPISGNPYNFHNDEPMSKVDYLSGAAMMVKKEVIDNVGNLDTEFFLYFEDTDWCARAIRAGYDLIYVPEAIAWHAVSALSDSSTKIYHMEQSRIRFAIKNFDSTYIIPFLLNILGETAYLILRDIKNKNFLRSRLRLKAIFWNISNFNNTLKSRKNDFQLIKQNGVLRSYNKFLPLRHLRT